MENIVSLLTLLLVFQQTIPHDAAKYFDMLKNKSLKTKFLIVPEFTSTTVESCLNKCTESVKCIAVGVRGDLGVSGASVTCRLSGIPRKYLLAPFLSASFLTDDGAENVFYLSKGSGAFSPPELQLFYSLDSSLRGAPFPTDFVTRNAPNNCTVAFNTPANFTCKLMNTNYLRVPNSQHDYNVDVGSFMIGNRVTLAGWFMAKALPYPARFPLMEMYNSAQTDLHFTLTLVSSMSDLRVYAYPLHANIGTLPFALPLNEWHHFAATKNSSIVKFYINATVMATMNMMSLPQSPTGGILQIGRRKLAGEFFDGNTLDGCLAHLAVFNDTLSDEQVQDLAALIWTL